MCYVGVILVCVRICTNATTVVAYQCLYVCLLLCCTRPYFQCIGLLSAQCTQLNKYGLTLQCKYKLKSFEIELIEML